MTQDQAKEPYFGVTSFPAEWLGYVQGPARFLARIDPARRDDRRHALDVFFTGVTATVAFSALNLWRSGMQSAENQKLLQGEVVNEGLLFGGLTLALSGTILAWLLGGRRSPMPVLVMFGYTLGYLWPTLTIALIVVSHATSALLGVDWTAVVPFDTAIRGFVSPTPKAVALTAIMCAVLIWLLAFALYCYAQTFRAAQGLGLTRAIVVAVLAAGANVAAEPWLRAAAQAIGERFGPLIGWLLRIFA